MRQAILSALTACALLGVGTVGMPTAAEAQTVIIINGNQPYYPQSHPLPYPHRPVVYAPDYYYGAGYGYYGAGYGYYNGYDNGYTNDGCYTNCYPRPYWGW